MIKVVLELPDWVKKRHIRIFAGIEEVVKKNKGKSWMLKTIRCDMCGKCCINVPKDWQFGKNKKTGWCKNLIYYANEYRCDAVGGRPFYCCSGDLSGQEDYCCIKWEKVKIEKIKTQK